MTTKKKPMEQHLNRRADLRRKWRGLSPRYAASLESFGATPKNAESAESFKARWAQCQRASLFCDRVLPMLDAIVEVAERYGETRGSRLAKQCRIEAARAAIVPGEGGIAHAKTLVDRGLAYLDDANLTGSPVADLPTQSTTTTKVDMDDLMTCCKHEAGHCCVMLFCGYRVDWASVRSNGGGVTAITEAPRTVDHGLAFAVSGLTATDACGRPRFGLGSDLVAIQNSITKLTGETVDREIILDHPIVRAERERQQQLIASHLAMVVTEVADILFRNLDNKVDGEAINNIFDRWVEDRERRLQQ